MEKFSGDTFVFFISTLIYSCVFNTFFFQCLNFSNLILTILELNKKNTGYY